MCVCVCVCAGVYFAHIFAFIFSFSPQDLSFQILDYIGLDSGLREKTRTLGKPENTNKVSSDPDSQMSLWPYHPEHA